VQITGLAPPTKLGVFNNNLENGYRAFAERYFRCKIGDSFEHALPVKSSAFESVALSTYLELVNDNLELAPVLTTDEVVDAYTGTKRKVYSLANEKYGMDGISKGDAELRSFVKFEKCDLTKAPRVINPRSPVYNLCLGKFLKKNEHAYFDAIAAAFDQERVVFKGMDCLQSATAMEHEWDQMNDPVAIGGDASKFDMHVSLEALTYEHLMYIRPYVGSLLEARSIYERVIEEDFSTMTYHTEVEELCWLLSQQLHNLGTAYFDDGKLKFQMRGTRASGDLNTSLGNCLIMSAMTKAWSITTGVHVRLINNGDDCVYIVEREDERRWRDGFEEFYRNLGFRMVLEPTVDEFEQIEFCQSKPCRTIEGLKMVRNPLTLVTKGTMCLVPIPHFNQLRKWMMAVGVAEGSLGRGVPVVQAFARAMRRNGKRCSARHIGLAYHQSTRVYHADLCVNDLQITDVARLSFYNSWGITPDEQICLEKYYDSYQIAHKFGETVISDLADIRDELPVVTVPHLLTPVPTI